MSVHRRNHPIQRVSTHPLFYSNIYSALKNDYLDIPRDNPLSIGHDVWIGRNAIILPSCEKIGNGAIVGAGTVVTKDVEPYTIIVGNPGKVLRRRYPKNIEEKIIHSRWWLQPLSSLADKLPCFINDPSIDLFDRFNF
jgi:acetyltransferase-like isoleucine patch superfamily enzyme